MHRFLLASVMFLIGVSAMNAEVRAAAAPPVISVVKKGAEKDTVSLAGLKASGPYGQMFIRTLSRDLELSGWFKVASAGAVRVNGTVADAGSGIQSGCRVEWPGKAFNWSKVSMGQAEVRRQAHQLADEMVRLIAGETGIAQSRIVFVNRRGRNNADLYTCDADGQGIMQITHDNVAAVGPRWAPNGRDIYYTSFLKGYPAVYRMVAGSERKALAALQGLNTGAAVAPDGSRVAIILSYQGNPELYSLSLGGGQLTRLTQTPHGAEASPCWSPDGRSIVYVSDIAKAPQLYIVDVASRKSRRLTYKGTENVNPDWNKKGRIVYATKRGGGYQIATVDPRAGEGSCELLTPAGDYEHPSWAPDGRHVVCSSRSSLYILDTLGDPAVRLINIAGNWMSPDWSDR
ncbi:MAG TPA: DPP IV N-terminal domain-containing protein [Kiritimatiellia bacterium]|mgnify:CR=1 FL=1|nr:DPP IV N-terminal domain-containing protein [Kiritimatiellia bacterium]HPS07545.1 DPP IV N-terminal domain-containing protein [Kiritimatiellia bacterium]